MKEKYVIAISIVLSTIIYVYGNRYDFLSGEYTLVFDKFTGKVYSKGSVADYVDGTAVNRKLIIEVEEEELNLSI